MTRFSRPDMLSLAIDRDEPWDMLVVGGGATGVGVALDAACRGFDVLLLERSDLGKGTSSRSTKLVHGGVRYLQQGNIPLVMEALRERGILRHNAPHLVHDLRFIVPNYDWWQTPFYGIGLKVYDMLARKYRFGPSRILSKAATLEHIPTLKTEGLRGGVQYYDGQFDDARLLLNLAQTAAEQGAAVLNYAPVIGLRRNAGGDIHGVRWRDDESGAEHEAAARCVINAAGPFADAVRRMDQPDAPAMIAPSQGVHLVLDRSFLPGSSAIMVPHTADGRVLFAIPWHGRTVVGTTDTPIDQATPEPRAFEHEIGFILKTAGAYLTRRPGREDVLSVFTGIRPLVRTGGGANTAALSRDHTIRIAESGLVTIVGGKWTTYRHMAEDCVNQAAVVAGLDDRPCRTRDLPIHGYLEGAASFGELAHYGSDGPRVRELGRHDPSLDAPIHAALPIRRSQVVWAARHEMARTADDVLARRTRALLLDARASLEAAPAVIELLSRELGRDEAWRARQRDAFAAIAACHTPATTR